MVQEIESTIDRALAPYELGKKLRQLRLRKKIGLVDLGKHTGLSPSMLSQLENGKMVPTLPTLTRIAMVFDVGLEHFFGAKREEKLFTVIRAEQRLRFPDTLGAPSPDYFFESLTFSAQGRGLHAYVAEFPPKEEAAQEHAHDGMELIYVLEGEVAIRWLGEEQVLRKGDSLQMDSSEPHSYRGASDHTAWAIVVTLPPRS